MEDKKRLSPGEWLENIWYHYKWIIIFGGMILVLLVISFAQCTAKDDPDVNILHVGPMYISVDAADQIEATVKGLSEDYNGDGEINVDLLDITINNLGGETSDPAYYEYNSEGYTRFQTEIRAGDAVLYFLSEEYFNICVEEGLLTPLDEIIDDVDMPENVVSEYGVRFSELDASKLSGLSAIPDGAILCLRRSPEKDEITYGRSVEEWESNKKTFVNLIKYKS